MKSDELKLFESTLQTLVKDVTEIKANYALKSDIPDVSGFLPSAYAEENYAKKEEIPDTSAFLIANDLSQINKSIEDLESKNTELYQNLSMKVIKHTFTEPEQITLLPLGTMCSGKIFICTENTSMGKEYMEYDFKCRLGPSQRNSEHLNKLELASRVTSWLKGYAIGCEIQEGKLVLVQRLPAYAPGNEQWSHKVSVRIIGWSNE